MNIGILPSINLTKQKLAAKPGMSVCSRIIRLIKNQTKNQRKTTDPQKKRESDDKNALAVVKLYHNWVASRKTRMRWFFKEANSLGKPDAKNLRINSKGTIHEVYTTSSEYPGKERTIVGKNRCQSSSSAKSLRYEI